MLYVIIAVLAVYSAILVSIGIYSRKQSQTISGFLLGGRGVGPWFSAFAYGTTYFSAVIFIGYAGSNGWNFGISAVWVGIGNAVIGSLLAWMIFAEKTRNYTHRHDIKTMPEFFESRYNSVLFKKLAALIIFVFLIPYSASVYMGLGYLFEAVGLDYNLCMYIIAFVTAFYVFLGGYSATMISDLFQGFIMLAGVVFMVLYSVYNPSVGGFSSIIPKLKAIDPALISPFGGKGWFNLLSLVFLTSIGSWGLPQMMHKFYAIKDHKSVKAGTVISTIFALVIATSAYFVGSLSRFFFTDATKPAGDAIMPEMFKIIFQGPVGVVMMAIIIVLVLSASMSTLASIVLTSSSAVAIDLFDKNTKFEFAKKHQLSFLRILCVIFILLSLLIAILKPAQIISLMSFSWGTVAGTFIGPYFYGLYMKKVTKAGAYSGAAVAFVISLCGIIITLFIPKSIVSPFIDFVRTISPPALGMYSMIASFVITPLVSLVTKKG